METESMETTYPEHALPRSGGDIDTTAPAPNVPTPNVPTAPLGERAETPINNKANSFMLRNRHK